MSSEVTTSEPYSSLKGVKPVGLVAVVRKWVAFRPTSPLVSLPRIFFFHSGENIPIHALHGTIGPRVVCKDLTLLDTNTKAILSELHAFELLAIINC